MLDFIKDLKKKFNLVLLSNESKEGMENKIKKFELNKIFFKIYCSAFLGIAKPDKKIFKYVLKDLSLNAGKVIFIDDRQENIYSAKSLNINSILFKNINQLKKKLLEYKIDF